MPGNDFQNATRLIFLRKVPMFGRMRWWPIPNSEVPNPFAWGPWLQKYQLRCDVLNHRKLKCGVAFNPNQLRELLIKLGSPVRIPYVVGKRHEEDLPSEGLKVPAHKGVHEIQSNFGDTAVNAPNRRGVAQ